MTGVDVMMDHKQLMLFVAPRVASKWYHVGVALALTPPFLEDIEENNGSNMERCISDVFQAWREERPRPYTWESLLIALRAVGVEEMDFANELELQIQSLQHQQQQHTMSTSSLQPPAGTYSHLQHNSNQSTPHATPCRHVPTTNDDSMPYNVTAATTSTRRELSLNQGRIIKSRGVRVSHFPIVANVRHTELCGTLLFRGFATDYKEM